MQNNLDLFILYSVILNFLKFLKISCWLLKKDKRRLFIIRLSFSFSINNSASNAFLQP